MYKSAYIHGFSDRCATYGVDPAVLLKHAGEMDVPRYVSYGGTGIPGGGGLGKGLPEAGTPGQLARRSTPTPPTPPPTPPTPPPTPPTPPPTPPSVESSNPEPPKLSTWQMLKDWYNEPSDEEANAAQDIAATKAIKNINRQHWANPNWQPGVEHVKENPIPMSYQHIVGRTKPGQRRIYSDVK